MLEVTKISSKGQVTIPIELRKKLKLASGDIIAFIEGDDGKIYVISASMLALRTAQKAFDGEARNSGIYDENDLIAVIKETRDN